jgi:hypothetical protein
LKTAIVKGGFEGIRKQMLQWRRESDIEALELVVQHHERMVLKASAKLQELRNERSNIATDVQS